MPLRFESKQSLDLNKDLFPPVFLEAESCNKLLQSNLHATNGTYKIAVNSKIFWVSDSFLNYKVFDSVTVP